MNKKTNENDKKNKAKQLRVLAANMEFLSKAAKLLSPELQSKLFNATITNIQPENKQQTTTKEDDDIVSI